LYFDVNEGDLEASEPLNIAFIVYVEGSYFGDSDIFFQDEASGRDSTAIADSECHLLVLNRKDLMALSEDFELISNEIR
jgi:CRP-like cAMP-binding protein